MQDQDLKKAYAELEKKYAAAKEQIRAKDYDILKYRLASDAIGIGLWEMDVADKELSNLDHTFIWSQELRNMLGFTDVHDFPNVLRSLVNQVHPEDLPGTRAAFEAHVRDHTGNTPYDVVHRLRLKNGEYRHFHAFGNTLRDDTGKPVRVAGALRDITEKKLLENAIQNALEESNRTVNTVTCVLNKSGAMIYVVDPDTDTVLFMTDSMQQHFDIQGDVIGRTCYGLLNNNPDSRCDFCPAKQLQKESDRTQILEISRSRANGYYRMSSRNIAWPDDRRVRIQSVTDLTDAMRTRKALEVREKLDIAFNQMELTLLSQKDRTFDDVLGECLRPVADATGLDRIDFFTFVDVEGVTRPGQVYRWAKSESGLTLPDENLKLVPLLPVTENWIESLAKGDSINIHTGIMTADELAFLGPLSVRSMLLVPVYINDSLWGAVSFQDFGTDRLFDDDSINFLNSVARYCADAILKNRIKNELAQADERMRLLLDSAPFYCQLWDSSFKKIDCNSEALRLFGFPDKEDFLEKYLSLYPEYQPDGERSTEKIARLLEQALEEGTSSYDWTYRMLDGSLMPTKNVFVKVAYGSDFAIAGYTRDLREQYAREAELKRILDLNELQLTKLGLTVKATRIGLWDAEWEEGKVICPTNHFNWSDDLRQMLGFTDENDFPNVLGSWSDRLHPEDREITRNAFAAHVEDTTGKTPYDTEFRVMKKNGEYGHFRSAGEAIRDEKGNPVRVAGALIEITEMKKMTQALNDAVLESQKTIDIMSSILNNTDAMIYVSDKDTWKLLFVNDYMKRHFGIPDDVIGQHCYQVLYDGLKEQCSWCPVPQLDTDAGNAITWENHNALTNRYYRNTNRYIDWPGGKKVHVQHSVDLTDVKQMQDDLNYSQKMLLAINDASSLLLNSDIDTFEGTLHQSMKSLANVLGIDRISIWKNVMIEEHLHYSPIFEWSGNVKIIPDAASSLYLPYSDTLPGWKEALSNGNSINALVRDLSPKEQAQLSRHAVLSLLVIPVFMNEQFWGFVGFDNCRKEKLFAPNEESILKSASVMFVNACFRNEILTSLRETSTQLEMALEEAQTASRAKGEFLRTVSHEIRTPMNVILGLTELQLQTKTLEDDTRETFDRIHSSGDMLLGIINDILDMSIIESGRLEVAPETYETASLISDTTHTSMVHLGSKPVAFQLHVDENMPVILFGDALRIKQILNNLLSNAFKYTDSGSVSLSFHTEDLDNGTDSVNLVFVVSDTGQGMTEDELSSVFDTYTRFNLRINQSIPGTGLGMPIVKNLLDLMNGQIETESEPGQGTRFIVRIPQTRMGPEVLGEKMVKNLQRFDFARGRRMKRLQISREPMPYGRVLIVDDVESNVYVAQGLLKPYRLKIDTALSGFEAIEKIESGKEYDIVFMDHMMPRMDGMETTKVMREKGYQRPIVALTANAVVGQAEVFLQNGFDDFISKPIDLRQLNNVLNRLIRDRYLAETPDVVEAVRLQTVSMRMDDSIMTGAGTRELTPVLIETFIRDASGSASVFDLLASKEGPWSDEDKRIYRTHMHAMKSALSHVGRQDLSFIAGKLEISGYDGTASILQSVTDSFTDSLRTVMKEFAAKDNSQFNLTHWKGEAYLREKLLAIRTACADYDANSIHTILRKLRENTWSQSTIDLLAEITIFLLNSEFGRIVDAIDRHLDTELAAEDS